MRKFSVTILFLLVVNLLFTQVAVGKNIVSLRSGIPFEEQVRNPHTTYIITNDFELYGKKVVLPEQCDLLFKAGSKLSNGVLVLNETEIESRGVCFDQIVLLGTAASDVYAKWFSNKTTSVLYSLFRVSNNKIVLEKQKKYILNVGGIDVFEKDSLSIIGNNSTIIVNREKAYLNFNHCNYLHLSDLVLDGCNITAKGIALYSCDNSSLDNVTIRNIGNKGMTIHTYALNVNDCKGLVIDNCLIQDVEANSSEIAAGIVIQPYLSFCENIIIRNTTVRRIWSRSSADGLGADCIKIAGQYDNFNEVNVTIDKCNLYDFTKRAVKVQASNVTISNCQIGQTAFMDDKIVPTYAISTFGSNTIVKRNTIMMKKGRFGVSVYSYPSGHINIINEQIVIDERYKNKGVEIKDNTIEIEDAYMGVCVGGTNKTDIQEYNDITITGNKIACYTGTYGIRFLYGRVDGCTVERNKLNGFAYGIYSEAYNIPFVQEGNEYLYAANKKHVVLLRNTIKGDGGGSKCAFYIGQLELSEIKKNTISDYDMPILIEENRMFQSLGNAIMGNKMRRCNSGIVDRRLEK